MKLIATDGPIAYGMHTVKMTTKDILIMEVALNELRERLWRGLANSEITRSTCDLWMKNRFMHGGIHESYISTFERDNKAIIEQIGLKP
jgi:hypothetical protein